MPSIVTGEYLLGRAADLAEQAKNILANTESTAEDLVKADNLKLEATSYQKRYQDVMGLEDILKHAVNPVDTKNNPATPNNPVDFKHMGEFLHSVYLVDKSQKKDPRLTYFSSEAERKDLAEAVGSTGGYLVPEAQRMTLMSVAAEQSIVRGRGATVIPMGTRQVSMPVLDQTSTTADTPHWFGGIQVYWQAEAQEIAASQPAFREIQLTANELVGYTRASETLVADSAVALDAFLTGQMGFGGAVAWAEDRAFFSGNGVGQPLGILNAGVTSSVARQVQGSVTYEDLLAMEASFYSPSNKGVWIISQSQKLNVMKMTGPVGNPFYVYRPSAKEGEPDMLLGRPVIFTLDRLPRGTATSVGDVMLADFSFYLIGDRQRVTVDSTRFDRWAFNQISWKVVTRVDGQPWLSAPITSADGATTVSPFVVLGAKAT